MSIDHQPSDFFSRAPRPTRWGGWLCCGLAIMVTAYLFYDAGVSYGSIFLAAALAVSWMTNWLYRWKGAPPTARKWLEPVVLAFCLVAVPVLPWCVLWAHEDALMAYIDGLPSGRLSYMEWGPVSYKAPAVKLGVCEIVYAKKLSNGVTYVFTSSSDRERSGAGGGAGEHGGWVYEPGQFGGFFSRWRKAEGDYVIWGH